MRDIDTRLIQALCESKDIRLFKSYGVSPSMLSKDSKAKLEWVLDYLDQFGVWPEHDQLNDQGILFSGEPDPLGYACQRILERKLGLNFNDKIEAAILAKNRGDLDEAIRLTREVGKLTVKKSKGHSFKEDFEERVAAYDAAKSGQVLKYLPSPWETFNKVSGGFGMGTMSIMAAKTGIGKTWISCILAAYYYSIGKKVGLISLEMPYEPVAERVDSVYHHLLFKDLRDTDLDIHSYSRWIQNSKQDLTKSGDIIIVDKKTVGSVADAAGFCAEHEPDILIADGGYLFESKIRGTGWEQTVDVVLDIMQESQYSSIPWVVTTQQNADTKKKMGRDDHQYNIRYGKEWSLGASNLLLLNSNSDLEVMRRREILLAKSRQYADNDTVSDDGLPKFEINWDTENFDFSEVAGDFNLDGLTY